MNNFTDINYRREYEIPHRYGYNYNRYDPRVQLRVYMIFIIE